MTEALEKIRQETLARLQAARDGAELDEINVSILGRNGALTGILRGMGQLSKDERAKLGQAANTVKKELEAEIRDALVGMGFTTYEGPEVEYDDYNFTKLNLPLDHPARDMQDTFYVNDRVVLRTHTSPCEARALLNVKPPFRLIMPGRVFRVDEVDASHSPVFMQIEGFVVDREITLADLKGILLTFIHAVFGDDVRMRFRPSYFPFTEPSAEVDISCTLCGGKGCRACKGTGWLEILGCGVSNPHIIENCGLDPKEWKGVAFGVGVDRITNLKHGITDIRLEYENDARFLRQF